MRDILPFIQGHALKRVLQLKVMALDKCQNIMQPSGGIFPFLFKDNLIGCHCVKNGSNITRRVFLVKNFFQSTVFSQINKEIYVDNFELMNQLLQEVIQSLPPSQSEFFDALLCYSGFLSWNKFWNDSYI